MTLLMALVPSSWLWLGDQDWKFHRNKKEVAESIWNTNKSTQLFMLIPNILSFEDNQLLFSLKVIDYWSKMTQRLVVRAKVRSQPSVFKLKIVSLEGAYWTTDSGRKSSWFSQINSNLISLQKSLVVAI